MLLELFINVSIRAAAALLETFLFCLRVLNECRNLNKVHLHANSRMIKK